MEDHEKIRRAEQRVEAMTGFYIHLVVFALVMTLLLVINFMDGGMWWVQWPFLGWGLGLLAHVLAVFGRTPRFIRDWQLRKIKELKDKM